MSGFRAYCENLKDFAPGKELSLSAQESRHLCGSLRAKEGDEVDVFDLSGLVAKAVISKACAKSALLKLGGFSFFKNTSPRIILAQALPKGKTFDDIIALCVQIGVSAICPILSEHCVVKIGEGEAKKKLEKWNLQLIEAVKQSANMSPIEIMEPMAFKDFLTYSDSFESEGIVKCVASLEACNPTPLLSALKSRAGRAKGACVLIGCEGDFSKSEYEAAYAKGFVPVTLGKNVLKCEVAAAFSMSLCSAYFADRGGVSEP